MNNVALIYLLGRGNKIKNANGSVTSGVYYPAGVGVNGPYPARWEGKMFVNGIPFRAADGSLKEPDPTVIPLQVWNGGDAKPGRGLADLMAKQMSPGKELGGQFNIKSHNKRLFIDNTPQVDHLNRPITYPALMFVLDRRPNFGDDSRETILTEIENFERTAQLTVFGARPRFYNVAGHADEASWKKVLEARRELVYQPGMTQYGYAKVIITESAAAANAGVNNAGLAALLANPAIAALLANAQQMPVLGAQPVINDQQVIQPAASSVANPVIGGNATDLTMVANPQIAALIAALQKGEQTVVSGAGAPV